MKNYIIAAALAGAAILSLFTALPAYNKLVVLVACAFGIYTMLNKKEEE